MLSFGIVFFIVFIFTLFAGIIAKIYDPSINIIILVIFAISSFIITQLTNMVLENISDPGVRAVIEKQENKWILIISSKKAVSSLAMNLHVPGEITNIQDEVQPGDAKTIKPEITNSHYFYNQENYYDSHVVFFLENIIPNKNLKYIMYFKPIHTDIGSPIYNNFKILYTWQFSGELRSREKWISVTTGKQIKEPSVQIFTGKIYKRPEK